MNAKPSAPIDRERQREWIRRSEARFEAKGGGRYHVRLSPGANRMMRAICEHYGCTARDVVEGLLLGNVQPVTARAMVEHGLSPAEALAFVEAGQ